MACEYLYPEMKAAVEAEGFSDLEIRLFPARCGRPPIRWEELEEGISESDEAGVEIFGSYCLQNLENMASHYPHCKLNQQEQCFNLLCSPGLVNSLQQNGAYLLTPGWLACWKRHVSEWGFAQKTAADFFGLSVKKLVLLDTGLHTHAQKHLEQFSTFLDLPWEVLPIGLDYHRLVLSKKVSGYQQQELEKQKDKALQSSADFAMAMDFLGIVTKAETELEVIDGIVHFLTMLLAPETIHYIQVIESEMQLNQVEDLAITECHDLDKFFTLSQKRYLLNGSGDSFMLRMGRGDQVSAILSVKKVAFPQHIDRYLNVAIHVSDICALAIEHTRTIKKLIDTSRLAGKAEVATEVLHNVGNSLNSISVSSEQMHEMIQKSSCQTLPGIIDLIEQHKDNIVDFFSHDPRGKQVPLYFSRLAEQLLREQQDLLNEAGNQLGHIRLVTEIIRTQQDTAKAIGLIEQIKLSAIVEECLKIFQIQTIEKQIEIIRDYQHLPVIHSERHKILQAVNNLISNAVDSFDGMEQENNTITLGLFPVNKKAVMLEIQDNGMGMDSDTLQQIFVFGFTTKKNGHGFGLHNTANLIGELGGTVTAESLGKGKGATFRLLLPVRK